MGAFAAIRISSYEVVAQKATSGVGNTHGTMDEGLNLHLLRDMGTDVLNLCKGQLTGSNHTGGSHIPPEIKGSVIGVVGLGTDMNLNIGIQRILGNHEHTGICNQDRIRMHFVQLFEILLGLWQVIIMGQNIGGNVHLHIPLMGELYSFHHLFMGKVLGLGTKSEGFSTDIHRIGTVNYGNFKYF